MWFFLRWFLFILDRLIILEVYTSWPLILVAVGVALFLLNPHSLTSWIVGGIGVIFFVVNFVIAFFPEVEAWSDLVWPTILVIIGILLLYRYYQPPAQRQNRRDRERRQKNPQKFCVGAIRMPTASSGLPVLTTGCSEKVF